MSSAIFNAVSAVSADLIYSALNPRPTESPADRKRRINRERARKYRANKKSAR